MKKRRLTGLFLSVSIGITSIFAGGTTRVSAEETTGTASQEQAGQEAAGTGVQDGTQNVPSTATLRLMYTTDSHGQVTGYDYQASKEVARGLDRISTMMKQAREEMGNSNYMTFDIGDNIMDYNTDYIYNQDSTALQPIYKALSLMGYDAITLGNHEFDFGYDYIVSQLEESGMMDKVILSNVTSKITGDYVFGVENKIVEKEVIDSNGNSRIIKVGLFGVTPPSMSARTEASNKNLSSEDSVLCAQREAAALKAQGADVVIALSHSGFGTETPANRAANVDYAMSKINEIDVILGGHEHVFFPKEDQSGVHYLLPNVDKETGLVNGKRLMILRDSARALGIVDLNFSIDGEGKVVLDNSDYEIREVSNSVTPDSEITATMDEWGKRLTEYSTKVIGKIKDGERWQSYTGLLEDSELIQIVQNAEIDYASNLVMTEYTEYKDYPIIAMVRYPKYGSDSGKDYSDLYGELRDGDSNALANYHRYLNLYVLSGQQLKEWLEWSASIYQTVGTSKNETWDNLVVDNFVKETGIDSLSTDQTLMNWSRLFRCEGVEYTINPSIPPRYNYEGDKISDYERITSLTLNGQPVAPEQMFVMVCEQFTSTLECDGTAGASGQKILKTYNIIQDVITDYLKRRSLLGDLTVKADRNWKLDLPDNHPFMLLTGIGADQVVQNYDWYGNLYDSQGDYNYYQCTYRNHSNEPDTQPPGIVLSSSNWQDTDLPVTVSVLTHDISGVAEVKYVDGRHDVNDEVWGSDVASGGAVTVDGTRRFEVKENGVYSVYVRDNAGNAAVEEIGISNINPDILLKPTVDPIDNNDVMVSGTGAKGMQICLTAGKKIYTGDIDIDGDFTISIPPFKANTVLYFYVKDKKGRTSEKRKVVVKRVGPNCPLITTVNNNGRSIRGNANDKKVKLYAVIGNTVYVSKALGVSYYNKCKKYDKKKKIVKTSITIEANGTYTIRIPNQNAGQVIKVFSVDTLGRVSYGREAAVKRIAPNRPKAHASYSGEKYVFGRIPDATKACYVSVRVRKKYYNGYSDENGYFTIKTPKLKTGEEIRIYARDSKSTKKWSYVRVKTVGDITAAYKKYLDTSVKAYKITARDTLMSGNSVSYHNSKVYVVSATGGYYSKIDQYGDFEVKLGGKQKKNTYVYMVVRKKHGALQAINRKLVVEAPPTKPKFKTKLYAKAKSVIVVLNEVCTVKVKVGKKVYTTSQLYHPNKSNKYLYIFKVKKLKAGDKVRAYAKNEGGISKSKWTKVQKVKKSKKSKKSKSSKSS